MGHVQTLLAEKSPHAHSLDLGKEKGGVDPAFWLSLPSEAQMVKNQPVTWEKQVRSMGWEDHLEKGMATHSSILAWRTPQRSLVGPWDRRVGHD